MNWYQNEVNEEIKGVGSRNKVKCYERSEQLFLESMVSVVEQEWRRVKSKYFEDTKQRWGYEGIEVR